MSYPRRMQLWQRPRTETSEPEEQEPKEAVRLPPGVAIIRDGLYQLRREDGTRIRQTRKEKAMGNQAPCPCEHCNRSRTLAQCHQENMKYWSKEFREDPGFLTRDLREGAHVFEELDAPLFQLIFGQTREAWYESHQSKDLRSRIFKSLRCAKTQPAKLMLKHRRACCRKLRTARRYPKPAPGPSPLRQAYVSGPTRFRQAPLLDPRRSPRLEAERVKEAAKSQQL